MMKKLTVLFALLAFFALMPFTCAADEQLPAANLAGVLIVPAGDAQNPPFIRYGDGSEEFIGAGFKALFINGGIVKDAGIITENGWTLLPARLISEGLGADVSWSPSVRKVTITDGGKQIELLIDGDTAYINGEPKKLDAPAKLVSGKTYVPARFVAEALGADVSYSDGEALSAPYMFPRIPHVMISRYPDSAVPTGRDEAIEIVRGQLITAYEKRFETKYEPLDALPESSGYPGGYVGDEIALRVVITNLRVVTENDRYYAIPVVFDFWVDKYTGQVYVFYNGQGMSVTKFDPLSEHALMFAG